MSYISSDSSGYKGGTATVLNLTRYRGDTILVPITTSIPEGAVVRAQLRRSNDATTYVVLSIDDDNNVVIPASVSIGMEGKYIFDVEFTDTDGIVSTVMEVILNIIKDTTRSYGNSAPAWTTDQSVEVAELITKELYFRLPNNSLVPPEDIVTNESERIEAEEDRVSAEVIRESNEGIRVNNEIDRIDAENIRIQSEGNQDGGRVKAEADRVIAENARCSAEVTRSIYEQTRVSSEQARVVSEGNSGSGRVKAEADRVIAENARVIAEGVRVTSEQARVVSEGNSGSGRVKAEADRVIAENARVSAEGNVNSGRVKAEADRVTAENARVVSENARRAALTFHYIRYASDTNGTGFTSTPSDSLKYRGEIHSATDITPVVGDFAGKWVKYIGDVTATDLALKLDKSSVKTVSGTSATDTVSQKFVTDELALKASKVELASAVSSAVTAINYTINLWYGIECDITATSPDFTRIGNLDLHRSLPIQSKMRRCILKDDRTVNYYLGATNSLKKEDGVTDAVLDGTDGQFMVEIPVHYRKTELVGNVWSCKFSEVALDGYELIAKHYISAGEANLQRSTNKLSCVINNSTDYRGGNNTSAWDAGVNSLLGKPVTNISRTNFRTYASNRGTGWALEIPTFYNSWRYLAYCEFATRNIQQEFNATLTGAGYKQGGLGAGVTTAINAEWNTFNTYNPFVTIGVTSSLGNASGVVNATITDFGGAGVSRIFSVPSFRGIENPFGHIWKWIDGYNMWAQTVAEGEKFLLYKKDSVSGLTDATSTGYTLVGELPRSSNYLSTVFTNDLLPLTTGAPSSGSTTFWCDYFYTSSTTLFGWRAPIVGGSASSGAYAGFVCVTSDYAASSAHSLFGSRLCCFGS